MTHPNLVFIARKVLYLSELSYPKEPPSISVQNRSVAAVAAQIHHK